MWHWFYSYELLGLFLDWLIIQVIKFICPSSSFILVVLSMFLLQIGSLTPSHHTASSRWHKNYHNALANASGRWHENYHLLWSGICIWEMSWKLLSAPAYASGRWHGILNLLLSLIVFCTHLNQLEGSVHAFTMLPKHTTQ